MMACWYAGMLVNGILYGGMLVRWYDGMLVSWYAGKMVCWYAGMLVCWYAGKMVRWYDGGRGSYLSALLHYRAIYHISPGTETMGHFVCY